MPVHSVTTEMGRLNHKQMEKPALKDLTASLGLRVSTSRSHPSARPAIHLFRKEPNMPIYQVVTSGVDLSQEQRATLARRFTETHHENTKAPEPFIRVVFTPMPLGLMFTAGEVAPSFVLGAGCRAGRSEVTRRKLMTDLYNVIREVTDLPPDQIFVAVTDTPSSWVMEAGLVLPEPVAEDEAVWMQKLSELFPGKYDTELKAALASE